MIVIHQDYRLEAIEREPRRWVTRITHLHGKDLVTGKVTNPFWDTPAQHSAEYAIKLAKVAIDSRTVTALP